MRNLEKFEYSYGIRGILPFSIRPWIRRLERDLLRQERLELGWSEGDTQQALLALLRLV